MDRAQQALVSDVQQRDAGPFVHAPALGLDDAVFDLVGDAQSVPAADPVGLEHQLHPVAECLAVQRDREAFLETHRDFLGPDFDCGVPVLDRHDRLHDPKALVQELELLGLVGGAPDVRVGRVGLLGAGPVRKAARGEPLAHFLATAQLAHEVRIQPGLVDPQRRIGQQTVPIETLDVVALVRGAVAPD